MVDNSIKSLSKKWILLSKKEPIINPTVNAIVPAMVAKTINSPMIFAKILKTPLIRLPKPSKKDLLLSLILFVGMRFTESLMLSDACSKPSFSLSACF